MAGPHEAASVSWFSFDETSEGPRRGWRSELRSALRRYRRGTPTDDVVLATSELVSNAVEHGGGAARIHVEGRRGVVRVEVEDHDPSLRLQRSRDEGDRGRGLAIASTLADEWGWYRSAQGKTVWAVFGPRPEHEDREGHRAAHRTDQDPARHTGA